MSDAFFARNQEWLRAKARLLRADRHFARQRGNTALVAAIDTMLAYYDAAMSNNDGGLFPIDTMETVHGL